jgi:nucleoredoxin
MQSYLPATLLTKSGPKPTSEVLANKRAVGLYFSAHWCPPCRGFTPVLAQFYKDLQKQDPDALEIIFVSSDQDDGSFNEYYGEMPWTSVIFGAEEGDSLGQRFGVRGIPSFQICDPTTGKVVDADGRSTVMNGKSDPKAASSRWTK